MTRERCFAVQKMPARARAVGVTVGLVVVAVALAPSTAAAARVGNLIAWGHNTDGDLGNANATDQPVPVRTRLAPDVTVTSVAGGFINHSLAVTAAGGLLGWGGNAYGKLGDGASLPAYTPIAADLSMLAPDEGVTAVAAGYDDSVALTSAGRVLAFGYGVDGELGNGLGVSSPIPVVVTLPTPDTKIKAIAAGYYFNLALTTKGQVLAWGANTHYALADATSGSRTVPAPVALPPNTIVTAIAAGGYSAMALTSTGTVLSWGVNDYGQLGTGSTTPVASAVPSKVALPDGVKATAIAAGLYNGMAVTSTGGGFAWGYDGYGEIGDGKATATIVSTPQPIVLPPGVALSTVSQGIYHSAALTTGGKVLTWGTNTYGDLGNASKTAPTSTPDFATLPDGTFASSIDAGGYDVLAVTGPQPITARTSSNPVVEAHERLDEQQPPDQVLRCIGTPTAILDVYRDGDRVRIVGVAAPGYTGQDVGIRFMATNEIVGYAMVAADNHFSVSVAAPASGDLGRDNTSYRAEIAGGDPSPAIKLARRLNITSVSRDGDTITVKGKVSRPFASPAADVSLIETKACTDRTKVGTETPDDDGNVTFKVQAPTGASSVFFRLDGRVGALNEGDGDFNTNSLGYGIAL